MCCPLRHRATQRPVRSYPADASAAVLRRRRWQLIGKGYAVSRREQEAREILEQHDLLFCYEMLDDADAREGLIRIALGTKPNYYPGLVLGNDTLH
jgi:hypothetical protein